MRISVSKVRITQIKVYQVDLEIKGTPMGAHGGDINFTKVDATIVEILTNSGITGIGEAIPFPNLTPVFAEGIRAGIREIAPALIGLNPLEMSCIHGVMDKKLPGNHCAKSPLDMALWDLLGKHCNLPLCTLLGGRFGRSVELYMTLPPAEPEVMEALALMYKNQGYGRWQFKVGGSVEQDIERITLPRKITDRSDIVLVDSNGAWTPFEAMRFANATKDLGVYLEQPCRTYDECLKVRQQMTSSMALDESICSLADILQAYKDNGDFFIGLKLSKLGGISGMKQCRDLCVKLGFQMKMDAMWGSEITQAALVHVAHSCPEKYRTFVPVLSSLNVKQVASGLPDIVNARITTTDQPGLGLTLNYDVIGDPIFTI